MEPFESRQSLIKIGCVQENTSDYTGALLLLWCCIRDVVIIEIAYNRDYSLDYTVLALLLTDAVFIGQRVTGKKSAGQKDTNVRLTVYYCSTLLKFQRT